MHNVHIYNTNLPRKIRCQKGHFVSNWNSKFSTLLNSKHSVQKAVDLTTPGKNRDKMSGKKWHFQIKKIIVFFRKLTWTWQLTSTTHSLPQCVLCSINISHRMVIMLSFHHLSIFFFIFISQKCDFLRFYWARVKSTKSSLFSLNFGEIVMSK